MMQSENLGTLKVLHSDDNLDLHFRFVGIVDSRSFIVTVHLPVADEVIGEELRPEEYAAAIARVMQFVIAQAANGAAIVH